MVVETFRDGDARPVYRRFRESGRLAPAGLDYVSSWVTADFSQCFQLMECEDRRVIDEWMSQWNDIVSFEIIPVVTSAAAVKAVTPTL
jgi:hypothetical protein